MRKWGNDGKPGTWPDLESAVTLLISCRAVFDMVQHLDRTPPRERSSAYVIGLDLDKAIETARTEKIYREQQHEELGECAEEPAGER